MARVCGSVRIALNVCEVAFAERVRELEQIVGGAHVREAGEAVSADGPSTPYSGGASSAPAAPVPLSPPSPFLSSPKGGAGVSGVLLTVAGAKGALNRYLVQRPEAVWGNEAEEQTPP